MNYHYTGFMLHAEEYLTPKYIPCEEDQRKPKAKFMSHT